MTWAPGPVVTRRRLGGELKRLRLGKGMKLEEVAEKLRCSMSKLSRLENGKGIPKHRDVVDLLDVYEVPAGDERQRLLEWSETGQQSLWWNEFSDVLPPSTEVYLDMEWDAQRVKSYEAHVPHGLLQTREYARAVLAMAWRGRLDDGQVDRLVDVRLRRQEALAPAHGLKLCCVLDESALYRVVGSTGILREQIRFLMTAAEAETVELRILPFSAGLVVSASQGAFAKLEFGENLSESLIYLERPHGESEFFADPSIVSMYDERLDALLRASLPKEESMWLLAQAHRRT